MTTSATLSNKPPLLVRQRTGDSGGTIRQPLLVRERSSETGGPVLVRLGTASFKTSGDALLCMLSHAGDRRDTGNLSRAASFWASHVTSDTGTAPLSLKSFMLKPNMLLQGVFVMKPVLDPEGSAVSVIQAECVPDDLRDSRLEHFIIGQGFCPTLEKFAAEGFRSLPVVLRMLETAINENANPDNEMFCCVAQHIDERGEANLYCLVTAIPLFAFHFDVLRLIAEGCNREKLVERIQEAELNPSTLSQGINVEGANCGMSMLALSPPDISPKPDLAIKVKGHRIQGWQACWSLEGLLSQPPRWFGEVLISLFTHMLLEARLLLTGEAPRICRVALALKAFLWPFRWPHLFLSAPIQQDTSIPLADAPFPMVGALFVRPLHIEDPGDPPIFAELGGLMAEMAAPSAPAMALPEDLQRLLVDRTARVINELRQGRIAVPEAAKRIHDAFTTVSAQLAEVFVRYAKAQVPDLRMHGSIEVRFRGLSQLERFREWHGTAHPDRRFYDTFFQTAVCNMFLKDVFDKLPNLGRIAQSPNATFVEEAEQKCCRRCVLQ